MAGGTARRRTRGLALLTLIMLNVGCNPDDLLEVETPDIITPDAINNAAGVEALRANAIGDFAELYAGYVTIVLAGGLMTDELGSGRTQLDFYDQRNLDPAKEYTFSYWADQKNSAERAIEASQTYWPEGTDRDTKIGHMLALKGMGMVLAAENFCNGIPFGSVVDGQLVFEEDPLSVNAVFERGILRLDEALALLSAGSDEANLALVGKARALLNLDRPAEAAAVAATVPTAFVWHVEYDETTLTNAVFDWIINSGNFTPTHREGNGNYDDPNGQGQGLDFIWSGDPRLQIETPHFRLAQDGSTRIYKPLKYSHGGAPIVAASGIEARLIEAEADLRAGGSTWLTTLNELRATMISPGLEPLADPGSFDARVDMLFRERAFWMYLTGHRLGDLRRLVRQYGRAAESVYPSGAYFKGGTYYDTYVMVINLDEQNRPPGAPPYNGCTNMDP